MNRSRIDSYGLRFFCVVECKRTKRQKIMKLREDPYVLLRQIMRRILKFTLDKELI